MRLTLLSVLFCLVMLACEDNDSVAGAATIRGDWELVHASRNNVETGLLEGLTYRFAEDGSLETNLMRNERTGSYRLEGDEIITEGVKVPLTYTIKELTDSTLNLRSQFQGYQFDFDLRRVDPPHEGHGQ